MLPLFPTANKTLLNILIYHYDKLGRQNLMAELVKYALVSARLFKKWILLACEATVAISLYLTCGLGVQDISVTK